MSVSPKAYFVGNISHFIFIMHEIAYTKKVHKTLSLCFAKTTENNCPTDKHFLLKKNNLCIVAEEPLANGF